MTDTPIGRPRRVGYCTLLSTEHRDAVTRATGLDDRAIVGMLLAGFDGVAADLSGLDHDEPATFLEVTRRTRAPSRYHRALRSFEPRSSSGRTVAGEARGAAAEGIAAADEASASRQLAMTTNQRPS